MRRTRRLSGKCHGIRTCTCSKSEERSTPKKIEKKEKYDAPPPHPLGCCNRKHGSSRGFWNRLAIRFVHRKTVTTRDYLTGTKSERRGDRLRNVPIFFERQVAIGSSVSRVEMELNNSQVAMELTKLQVAMELNVSRLAKAFE